MDAENEMNSLAFVVWLFALCIGAYAIMDWLGRMGY